METIRHYSRKELLKLARGDQALPREHLESCPECRRLVRYLAAFPVAGHSPLLEPPSSWINRAAAIPAEKAVSESLRRLVARLSFDSWVLPQPVGVRGDAAIDHRQMQFQADNHNFELRAERVDGGWEFVARLEGPIADTPCLQHGRRTVWPNKRGIFQWSASRPPRTLRILTEGMVIELPKLIWSSR